MATSNSSSREERRKKILERGSDRLALISGRIHSLPSSPTSSPRPHRAATASHLSTQSLAFTTDHHDRLQSLLSNQSNADTEGQAAPSQLLKYSSLAFPRDKIFDIGRQVDSQVLNHETRSEAKQLSAPDETTKSQPEPDPEPELAKVPGALTIERASHKTQQLPKPSRSVRTVFSSKRINSCIIASQGKRSICALVIALLVVISYIDDALLGINILSSESVEAVRPLYILLLTDVTIVLGQVLVKQKKQFEEAAGRNKKEPEDGNNMTHAIKLMERSLVLYQTARAVFIDFSIYIVVVICGLSLA